jgi:chemotaxis signal transduction protein
MENSWVLFELNHRQFALRTENVREMVLSKSFTRLPEMPEYFRGVANLRNITIPTVDLRKRLGMQGLPEATSELVELLHQRQQDHVNWLNELQASLHEDREFRLTTDPHKCKFGIWYDAFKTSDTLLQFQLGKFDAPHKRIHALGVEAKGLSSAGRKKEAIKLVEDSQAGDLGVLIRLFSDTRQMIQENSREVMLIVESNEKRTGFVVDNVTAVTDLLPANIEPPPAINADQVQNSMLGLAKTSQGVIILLDADRLLEHELC